MSCSEEENINRCKSIAEELEETDIYSYFSENEIYNIEYRVDEKKEYKSVEIMIACGGPNIYIDTDRKEVLLYWWSDEAEYGLSDEVCNSINSYFEDLYNSIE